MFFDVVDCYSLLVHFYYKVIMNKNEILQCLDLSDWSEDSLTGGISDSDEDVLFEV